MPKVHLRAAFTLRRDSGETIDFPAGIQDVSDEDAGHWYVKAHMDVADAAQAQADADNAVRLAEQEKAEQTRIAAEEAAAAEKAADDARKAADKAAADEAARRAADAAVAAAKGRQKQ